MKTFELTFFEVSPEGVLITPGIGEPTLRSDVFEQVDPGDVHSSEELIELIESCPPLADHFRFLADQHLKHRTRVAGLKRALRPDLQRRTGAEQLILGCLRRDPEEGWKKWIEYSGDAALEGFVEAVRDWLDEEIDWNESDYFDAVWSGQAAAKAYFEDLPLEILRALGVRIVEGDRPGSTYFAAELHKSPEVANLVAETNELDCRFLSITQPDSESCYD